MAKRRGKRAHTDADKKLMADVSRQLEEQIEKRFSGKGKVKQAARFLGVSQASLYNYIGKTDVPGIEVLRRLNELWGLDFEYGVLRLDKGYFSAQPKRDLPQRARLEAQQYVLPFLEGLREQDIEVLQVTARKPSSVELKLLIRFAG